MHFVVDRTGCFGEIHCQQERQVFGEHNHKKLTLAQLALVNGDVVSELTDASLYYNKRN